MNVCDPSPAIPFGRYRARVMRGIEYEFFEADLDLRKDVGDVVLRAPLVRAFNPEGTLAADLHVHANRSNDSLVLPGLRVLSEVSAGIQVIGSSDHNSNGDFDNDIDALGMRRWVASIAGNEVSIGLGHFNLFPVEVDRTKAGGGAIDATDKSARQLFDFVRTLPRRPLIQVNHPRYRWAAYFDSYGWNGQSWPPPMPLDFDSIEILPGVNAYRVAGDERQEEMIRDFYTMARNGVFVTAIGSSDTHHLSGVLAGIPRSYVYVDDPRTELFDEEAFLDALRRRRVVATSGPWLEVKAMDAGPGETAKATGGQVLVRIALRQASFVHADRIRVWVGGDLRYELQIADGATSFDWAASIPVGPGDTWIGVDATGDISLPIEISGDDLWEHDRGGMKPTALINPILIDTDGDGRIALPSAKPLGRIVDVPPPPRPGASEHCGCSEYVPPRAR
jgi:hypothetical protein